MFHDNLFDEGSSLGRSPQFIALQMTSKSGLKHVPQSLWGALLLFPP